MALRAYKPPPLRFPTSVVGPPSYPSLVVTHGFSGSLGVRVAHVIINSCDFSQNLHRRPARDFFRARSCYMFVLVKLFARLAWAGLAWAGLAWAGLAGRAGVGRAGMGRAGMGWAGKARRGLARPGLVSSYRLK